MAASLLTYAIHAVQSLRSAQDLVIVETYIPSGHTTDEDDDFSLTSRPYTGVPSTRSEVSLFLYKKMFISEPKSTPTPRTRLATTKIKKSTKTRASTDIKN